MWDWFEGSANNAYAFSGNILRVNLAHTGQQMDWQVEVAAPLLLGLPKDAIAPAPQGQLGLGGSYYAANDASRSAAMIFPKQAFLRFKGKSQSLRVGRFEFSDGSETAPKDTTLAAMKTLRINQRLIGPFAWPHVGRSYDGAHYSAQRGKLNVTVVAAMPTRGVFQVDGWGNLKTSLVYGSVTRATGAGRHAGEWRLLAMFYDDWRNVPKTDNRPAAARQADMTSVRMGTYGGHYIHRTETEAGVVNLLLWGVAQQGKWGRQDHASAAVNIEGGWQPKGMPRWKPWLSGGYAYAGGDGDPSDGKHGTFHQLLPTPRPFARFPFYNMMNNQDRFGMLTLRPHKAVTVRGEFHALRLSNARDLWYLGGGAFQPWTFGYVGRNTGGARGLANQYDASLDWNVNAHVALNGYYGYAQGKAAMRAVYPKGATGQFGYVELLYKF